MAFIEQDRPSRLPSIAIVALVHVGIGYAFLSGLAYNVLERGPQVLQLIQIADDSPPPPIDPAPLPRARTPASTVVTVPERVVTTPSQPVVIDVRPVEPPLTRADPGPTVAPPPPVDMTPPVRTTAAQARGDRTRWIGTDDYPASALRAGAEGSVGIVARIGGDGRVASCEVARSSGHPVLDQATCRLYASRARYVPATENGQAVATVVRDTITWRLPR